MTPTEFRAWLQAHNACPSAIIWFDEQPDRSPEAIWSSCHRGDWLLWWHKKAGTAASLLAPVGYRAADRAVRQYAAEACERAGLHEHAERLRSLHMVVDAPTARAAEAAARAAARAAWAAWAAEAAWEAEAAAARAAEAAREAEAAAARAAARAAWAAEAAARAAWAAASWEARARAEREEDQRCADDCRELLSAPEMAA